MMLIRNCPCSLSILFLIIKTQEKSGTVPIGTVHFFKFFEFRQSSYFKSGDSPSRKIQQSAFASLGFLLRGTVLKDRPPLKQGLSIIKDFGLGLQRTGPLKHPSSNTKNQGLSLLGLSLILYQL